MKKQLYYIQYRRNKNKKLIKHEFQEIENRQDLCLDYETDYYDSSISDHNHDIHKNVRYYFEKKVKSFTIYSISLK